MTRIIGWLLVAFALYYLLTDPAGAASAVLGIVGGLHHAGSAVSAFANRL